MEGKFKLTVVTPQRLLMEEDGVERVALRGSEGELGILYDHSPMVTPLGIGVMRARSGKEEQIIALSGGGFLEILPDKVTILADVAELPGEIDVERAREAKQRAEKKLSSSDEEVNFTRARAALMRALTRLEAAGNKD